MKSCDILNWFIKELGLLREVSQDRFHYRIHVLLREVSQDRFHYRIHVLLREVSQDRFRFTTLIFLSKNHLND
jgi:hypothetical protein